MKKKIFIISIFFLCIILFINKIYAIQKTTEITEEKLNEQLNTQLSSYLVLNEYDDNDDNDENKTNQTIINLQNNNQKKIEETTIFDIIKGEKVSPELKTRILNLLDNYQLSLDSYRKIIEMEYRKSGMQIFGIRKDLNKMYEFHSKLESNLDIAKWMIISLSVGIICLTFIVIVMWRSVVNVNRNDVEVIFSLEKFKKDLKFTNSKIENLEDKIKNNERK